MIGKLQIEVSPTATGEGVYVQIRSPGAIPVNIVLIADEVEVLDRRTAFFPERREQEAAKGRRTKKGVRS